MTCVVDWVLVLLNYDLYTFYDELFENDMSDTNKKAIITPDMIEMNEALQEVIANICDENIKSVIGYAFNNPFYMFENKDKPDEFFVFFSNGFEAKVLLSLDKLVDATLTCNNNKPFLNELANNFEMLAKRLRDA